MDNAPLWSSDWWLTGWRCLLSAPALVVAWTAVLLGPLVALAVICG